MKSKDEVAQWRLREMRAEAFTAKAVRKSKEAYIAHMTQRHGWDTYKVASDIYDAVAQKQAASDELSHLPEESRVQILQAVAELLGAAISKRWSKEHFLSHVRRIIAPQAERAADAMWEQEMLRTDLLRRREAANAFYTDWPALFTNKNQHRPTQIILDEIQPEAKKENTMELNTNYDRIDTLTLLQLENIQFAHCVFDLNSSSQYSYKIPKAWNVQANQLLIVPSNSKVGFSVVRVMDVVDGLDETLRENIEYKWAVGVVDTTEYDNNQKAEKDWENKMVAAKKAEAHKKAISLLKAAIDLEVAGRVPMLGVVEEVKAAVDPIVNEGN